MRKIAKISLLALVVPFSAKASTVSLSQWAEYISDQTSGLNSKVVSLALTAYEHARIKGLAKQNMLTIVDYSKPSYEKRLWVINLNNSRVEYNTLVAQGKGSGDIYATRFSNQPRTDASSIGVYVTGQQIYNGKHPDSLRLYGLDKGFNSNAYRRAIVMHPAWYASNDFLRQNGYLGRSWGCLAISEREEPKIANAIKGGSVIFAYYPDRRWLQSSQFLKPINVNVVSA